ncbi:hypothetical protein ANCCAN_10192 [Ancylostoma caninum]|uniref:Uncharacterized protein n=1 Tax=Ancylostoma caninum TaxID=29170 RepID=A0A368GHF2_ANCCA|nr:hypothetical protein ANCCAN_10192 [Ancylostoma caninum]
MKLQIQVLVKLTKPQRNAQSCTNCQGTNVVFARKYAENEISVSYVQWMAFAMPGMILCLLASYVVLMCSFMGPQHLYLWCSPPADDERHISQAVGKRVKAAYDSLGDFT